MAAMSETRVDAASNATSAHEVTMKTIATINFKGGVGKTTITWALKL